MGLLSDLFDPGKKDREAAAAAAREANFDSLYTTGPAGIRANFSSTNGDPRQSFSLGTFDPFVGMLQQQAQQGFSAQNLDPRTLALVGSGIGALDAVRAPDRVTNASNYAGLGQVFQSALPTATADPFALGESTAQMLRERSTRANENLVNKTFDRLFQSGGLANQTVREQTTESLSRQLNEQDLGFELAGLEAGRGLRQDALGSMFGAVQGREGIAGRNFGEQLSTADLLQRNAQLRFGMGTGFQGLLNQQQNFGQSLGLQALQGAAGITQLPLAFQQAALAAQGLKSDAALGVAGVHQNNAAMAKSPLLEAVNMAGQFAANIAMPGLGSLFGGPAAGAAAGAGGKLSTPWMNSMGTMNSQYNPFANMTIGG